MTCPRVQLPVRLRLGHSCWRGGRALKVALFANPQPGLPRGEFPGFTHGNGSYRDLFCWDIAHRSVGACSSGSVSLKRFRAGPPSVILLVLIAVALGWFRNPCRLCRSRSAATGRAGPALWRAPLTLNGPSGRWGARGARTAAGLMAHQGLRVAQPAHCPERLLDEHVGLLNRVWFESGSSRGLGLV